MGMTMGRKKRRTPFPSSHHTPQAFFFSLFSYWSTEREPLRRTTCISYNTYFKETKATTALGVGSIYPNIRILVYFCPFFPPIMRYTRSQYTGMRYLKTMLAGSTYPSVKSSPKVFAQLFSMRFPNQLEAWLSVVRLGAGN